MRVRRASNSKRQVQHHYLVDHLKRSLYTYSHFAQLEGWAQVTTHPFGLALALITFNRQVILSPVPYGKGVKGHIWRES